jgi:hypothetical protein
MFLVSDVGIFGTIRSLSFTKIFQKIYLFIGIPVSSTTCVHVNCQQLLCHTIQGHSFPILCVVSIHLSKEWKIRKFIKTSFFSTTEARTKNDTTDTVST